ncbi:histone acetylase complex subunit mrg15-2 [Grosmannia clavigera kw1407]|uniref:Chromatin modification-related protein EAF3 n=1 Tax=Grosmannia clavigera (strain kw1407 / UAMH 11150) TaxID=655863 RepID=F0XRT2_GROCL|nr:histone acetylase complex subunit mrg15-2 [Grosmannia clavigera kw1407]EFW99538.1 histone acetylase complex subunit mrg15-2 [Grosmannia clavigera kw1407]
MDMLYEARILDVQQTSDGQRWRFRIHYKGWKNTWDDWVPQDRVRKFNDENRELAAQLRNQARLLQQQKNASKVPKKTTSGRLSAVGPSGTILGATGLSSVATTGGSGLGSVTPGDRPGREYHAHAHHHNHHTNNGRESELASARGSEERTGGGSLAHARGPRRQRDYDLEHEDGFHNRPSIRLAMPDHLKAALVDDWENVTKNQQLVPLPHHVPAESVLDDYLSFERSHREEGSASLDILEETVAGLREYFDKCLGRILLYRFERPQYIEMHALWESGGKHKSPLDTYFVNEYETPNQQYVDKVRSA